MYAAVGTRPDIMYAVHYLSAFHRPRTGTFERHEEGLPLPKQNIRTRTLVSQETPWWGSHWIFWLWLGWRPKFPEICLRIYFHILRSHCLVVGKEATDDSIIQHQSRIHGYDPCWERSHVPQSPVWWYRHSTFHPYQSTHRQPISDVPSQKPHLPHMIKTHHSKTSLGMWEDWKWDTQVGLSTNSRSGGRHLHEASELREICEVSKCIGFSTCGGVLSGCVGNQCTFISFYHSLYYLINSLLHSYT